MVFNELGGGMRNTLTDDDVARSVPGMGSRRQRRRRKRMPRPTRHVVVVDVVPPAGGAAAAHLEWGGNDHGQYNIGGPSGRRVGGEGGSGWRPVAFAYRPRLISFLFVVNHLAFHHCSHYAYHSLCDST
jgi:hypothetical protein